MAHLIREDKAATTTSRAEVDTLHLSLQNVQYENRHLAGEIAATENHPHIYRELDLVSEEEFLATHPEWAEHRNKKKDDETISGGDEDIPAMTEDVTTEDLTTEDLTTEDLTTEDVTTEVTAVATPSENTDIVIATNRRSHTQTSAGTQTAMGSTTRLSSEQSKPRSIRFPPNRPWQA